MVKAAKKPTVTKEEQKFRDDLYPDVSAVKNKNILCTSCNASLKALILRGKQKTHPFMDTLLCEKCNSFFGDGDFSVDEDGSDKYCRWCGQGGTLFLCSKCTAGFCKKCIKRNLPRAALKEVESDDWKCYCCDVKPLYELRAHCWAANQFAAEFVNNKEGKRKRGKKTDEQDSGDSDSEFDDSSGQKKRKGAAGDSDEEEEIVSPRKRGRGKKSQTDDKKSRENAKTFRPIVQKLSLSLKDAISMTDLFKKKALDLTNKKINLNCIKDVNSVTQITGKVDSLLQSVETISKQLRDSVNDFFENWRKVNDPEFKDEESEEDKTDEEETKKKAINGVEDVEDENKANSDIADDDENDTNVRHDSDERTSPMKIDEEKNTPEKMNGSDIDGNDDEKTSPEKTNSSDLDGNDDEKKDESEETKTSIDDDKFEEKKVPNDEKEMDEDSEDSPSKKRKLENNDSEDATTEPSSKKLKDDADEFK